MGVIFDGTKTLTYDVSVSGTELIKPKSGYAHFTFFANAPILVNINNSGPLLMEPEDGFSEPNISSFILLTDDIEYRYFAKYEGR